MERDSGLIFAPGLSEFGMAAVAQRASGHQSQLQASGVAQRFGRNGSYCGEDLANRSTVIHCRQPQQSALPPFHFLCLSGYARQCCSSDCWRERHQLSPCNQQVSSSLWLSRRSDFTEAPRSRRKAAASRWLVAGSRAPWKSMNPARHRNRAANPSPVPRVTNSIAPGPSRDVVIGNKSRPLALSASSQEDSGCVAPALATIASTGSNGVLAPSA